MTTIPTVSKFFTTIEQKVACEIFLTTKSVFKAHRFRLHGGRRAWHIHRLRALSRPTNIAIYRLPCNPRHHQKVLLHPPCTSHFLIERFATRSFRSRLFSSCSLCMHHTELAILVLLSSLADIAQNPPAPATTTQGGCLRDSGYYWLDCGWSSRGPPSAVGGVGTPVWAAFLSPCPVSGS